MRYGGCVCLRTQKEGYKLVSNAFDVCGVISMGPAHLQFPSLPFPPIFKWIEDTWHISDPTVEKKPSTNLSHVTLSLFSATATSLSLLLFSSLQLQHHQHHSINNKSLTHKKQQKSKAPLWWPNSMEYAYWERLDEDMAFKN
jgi:hypothetical protein